MTRVSFYFKKPHEIFGAEFEVCAVDEADCRVSFLFFFTSFLHIICVEAASFTGDF